MDKVFFEELELPIPKYNLDVGSGNQGEQTAKILDKNEKILIDEQPDVVLVQGDTNTVLGGALAAAKLNIKVGHVEAGLRSYDRTMPEETNRIITDHISEYLFCPTEKSRDQSLSEGISENKLYITGNTIVDAVQQNLEIAKKKVDALKKLKLKKDNYLLITAHRPANVDFADKLESILKGLSLVYEKLGIELIYPIHPRTKKMIDNFNLTIPKGVRIIEPTGFLEFLQLEANAKLILTDSGGVQEEACILKIPCVTLRENTERPETLDVGSNILSGIDSDKILECVKKMLDVKNDWGNPFGDGRAGERIMDIINN
jgi:UDP-N-acetylglucosamine 2-epimerase (non-hydrolysing)